MRKKVDKPENYGVDREIAHDRDLYQAPLEADEVDDVAAQDTVGEKSKKSLLESFLSRNSAE